MIQDGRIAEMGTHAELLSLGGHYYRLYTQQFRQELVSQIDPLAALFEDEADGARLAPAGAPGAGEPVNGDAEPASLLAEASSRNGKVKEREFIVGD